MGNTTKTGLFYLFAEDRETGPFTEAEVRQKLLGGECSLETPAREDGMSTWAPISTALGITRPPPVVPAQPPLLQTTIPSAFAGTQASAAPGGVFYFTVGLLLPLVALILGSAGGGLLGLILVLFGGYNSGRAYCVARRLGNGCSLPAGCLGSNIVAGVLTLLILCAPSANRFHSGSQGAYSPSIAAWNVLISAMESARSAPPNVSISSTLSTELSAINVIDDRGVDRDLSALIQRRRDLLQRELRATSVIDSEARVVNDNAQLGSALLGVLFSAAGAQNDVDPWRGASRGQQAGTEMADGIRLGQLQEVLRKHESEIEGFKNEEAAFGAELIQLEQKLRFRYPGFFSHG